MVQENELEELITLTDACRILPRRRRGRQPSPSTLYRWAQKGIRGVRLETVQIAGTKCTSRRMLADFFQRLSAPSSASAEAAERAHKADEELESLNF